MPNFPPLLSFLKNIFTGRIAGAARAQIIGGNQLPAKPCIAVMNDSARPLADYLQKQGSLSNPSTCSVSTMFRMQQQKCEIAKRTLADLGLKHSKSYQFIAHLSHQLGENSQLALEQGINGSRDRQATKQELKNTKKLDGDLLTMITKELNTFLPGKTCARDAKAAWQRASVDYFNNKPWDKISNTFSCQGQQFLCQATPACKMSLGTDDIFPVCYHGKGVCSASATESVHAANLWEAKLFALDGDGKAQQLFSGIRSGMLCPYDEKDDGKRQTGALNRAKEVVTAALYSQPELLKTALSGKPVNLRMTSSALVTPGMPFRKEGEMLDEQVAAWRTLCQQKQPVSLQIRNAQGEIVTAKVNLQVLTFNFPVNEMALKFSFGLRRSDRLNQEGLTTLLGKNLSPGAPVAGWVGDYLRTNPPNTQLVMLLVRQIKEILAKKSHHSDGGEPYKLALRVILLSHEIGAIPAWNCKSGKDRTGMLAAELQRLMISLQLGDTVNEPDSPLSEEQRAIFHQVLLNGEHLEIQERNCGAPGNKVLWNFPLGSMINLSYQKRIGDPALWREVQGGAPYVKA
ncbi:MAG: inositol phosphate phosphatase SopB [Enterobacteriaceae bacterium]